MECFVLCLLKQLAYQSWWLLHDLSSMWFFLCFGDQLCSHLSGTLLYFLAVKSRTNSAPASALTTCSAFLHLFYCCLWGYPGCFLSGLWAHTSPPHLWHPFHLLHTVLWLSSAGSPSPLTPKPVAVLSSRRQFFCIPELSVSWHFNVHFCHSICASCKCWKTKVFIFLRVL